MTLRSYWTVNVRAVQPDGDGGLVVELWAGHMRTITIHWLKIGDCVWECGTPPFVEELSSLVSWENRVRVDLFDITPEDVRTRLCLIWETAAEVLRRWARTHSTEGLAMSWGYDAQEPEPIPEDVLTAKEEADRLFAQLKEHARDDDEIALYWPFPHW